MRVICDFSAAEKGVLGAKSRQPPLDYRREQPAGKGGESRRSADFSLPQESSRHILCAVRSTTSQPDAQAKEIRQTALNPGNSSLALRVEIFEISRRLKTV